MDIPVKARVVHEDLQPAANEENQQDQICVMCAAQPQGKPLGLAHRRRLSLDGNRRQPKEDPVELGASYRQQ